MKIVTENTLEYIPFPKRKENLRNKKKNRKKNHQKSFPKKCELIPYKASSVN